MTIADAVYVVRKQGQIKVATKKEADQIIEAGTDDGYGFRSRAVTWGWLVIDEDN